MIGKETKENCSGMYSYSAMENMVDPLEEMVSKIVPSISVSKTKGSKSEIYTS